MSNRAKNKKPLTITEKKAQILILNEINKTLDLLYTHLEKYCNEVGPAFTGKPTPDVPLFYINKSIHLIKENMALGSGVKGQPIESVIEVDKDILGTPIEQINNADQQT